MSGGNDAIDNRATDLVRRYGIDYRTGRYNVRNISRIVDAARRMSANTQNDINYQVASAKGSGT